MRCRDQVFLDLAVCAEQVGEGGREQRIFADFGDMTPVLCTAVTNLFRNFMSLATDRGERMNVMGIIQDDSDVVGEFRHGIVQRNQAFLVQLVEGNVMVAQAQAKL